MLHIKQAIVVEGKYDKIKLSSITDAVILTTNGFGIYTNPSLLDLIRRYAGTTGIIILTDSDSAGFRIRNYLKGAIHSGKIYHVYIPDIYGKERRKEHLSKEGKLGVEGIDVRRLTEAFCRAGVLVEEGQTPPPALTRLDLYEAGLTGHPDSRTIRTKLLRRLGLPERLSAAAMLDALNLMLSRTEFDRLMQEISAQS